MSTHHQQPEVDDLLAQIKEHASRPSGQRFEYDGQVYDRDLHLASLQKRAAVLKSKIAAESPGV